MLKNWWRALAPRPRSVARKSAPRRLNKARLALESLEDRYAPALITVTSLADNLEADGDAQRAERRRDEIPVAVRRRGAAVTGMLCDKCRAQLCYLSVPQRRLALAVFLI